MLPEGDRTFHTTAWSKGNTFPSVSETPLTNVGGFLHIPTKYKTTLCIVILFVCNLFFS